MCVSSWATTSVEDVSSAAPAGFFWLQLYIYKDREATKNLILRAEAAGYMAIALTVDTAVLGRRVTILLCDTVASITPCFLFYLLGS